MASYRHFLVFLVCFLFVDIASAHGGILNSDGCHIDEYSGDYHCHPVSEVPTSPDPGQRSDEEYLNLKTSYIEIDSWKNIGKLGYASAGVFSEFGLGFGKMEFQGADQTCLRQGRSGLTPQTCNLSSRAVDFGVYGEANVGLFVIDELSVFVGTEIGSAVSWGGKFYNCYGGKWDWFLQFSDRTNYRDYKCGDAYNSYRVSSGKLKGYSYLDVKVGLAEVSSWNMSTVIGNIEDDFAFLYLLAGQVEYSSDWGTLRKSEYGIGLDYHFTQHSSLRLKWTDRRLSFILRGHF